MSNKSEFDIKTKSLHFCTVNLENQYLKSESNASGLFSSFAFHWLVCLFGCFYLFFHPHLVSCLHL